MSDLELQQKVMDELDFEPRVNAAHIGVTAAKGIITLDGYVGSYAEKLAAEKAAGRVKGVHGIAQELEVRFAEGKKTADDEIASRAVNIIHWSTLLPIDTVQVRVQNGWITLTGEVEWQYQRKNVETVVRLLSGVKGITNHIGLKPRVQPGDIKHKIEDALKRNAQIISQGIRVSVADGGNVHLEGKVHDLHERDMIEAAAWSAPGVTKVEDRLSIS